MTHRHALDLERHHEALHAILREVVAQPRLSRKGLNRLLKQHLKDGHGLFSSDDLVAGYRALAGSGGLPPFDVAVLDRLRLKPIRSASGVTPLTVFTKPFPCPGECIFCPNDVRMPKSYLSDEPGAQRAEANRFDPYLQTMIRLKAFYNTGHPTDKIEVIILGGTWSFYPETYQRWFIRRVFDALHDFGRGADQSAQVERGLSERTPHPTPSPMQAGRGASQTPGDRRAERNLTYNQLVQAIYPEGTSRADSRAEYASWAEIEAAHRENEDAPCRCVGLVVETRPDYANPAEVLRLRRLGCTKVQLGLQSLDDRILALNRRGHTVESARRAIRLFRQAGFKIHAHWMPNLYGATPESDLADFGRLFADPAFRPDELKIYPCSLIESAELMRYYESGEWRPYSRDELLRVLTACLEIVPEYCRLTRIIRDIPSTDIVAGNKTTNLRQIAEQELARRGGHSRDIRAREIGTRQVEPGDLRLDECEYETSSGTEIFLQFITADPARQIAGFLRLALPHERSFVDELAESAIIREVHVYGQSLALGQTAAGQAQHSGLGTALIERAAQIAAERGYTRLAVISAVGTRAYYRKRGFTDGTFYQMRALK